MTHYNNASFDQAGSGLTPVAQAVGQALDQLRAALAGGVGLGNDEINTPFARAYQPMVDQALLAIASYQEQVRYAGEGLVEMARTLRGMEELNAEELARLRSRWQPPPAP